MSASVAASIRQALQTAGFGRLDVSVRQGPGSGVRVEVRRALVPLDRVQRIARAYESVRMCEASGEILCGGNTFVSVRYASGVLEPWSNLAQGQISAGRQVFGSLRVEPAGPWRRAVWRWVEGSGHHVTEIDGQRGGAELAELLAKEGALSVLEEEWRQVAAS